MSTATQRTYLFTVTLAGVPMPPDDLTDSEWSDRMAVVLDELCGRVLAAGCDDSTVHSEGATVYLDFHREAETLGDAIGSAVKALEAAGYGVARVDVA
jgi:hypothetical protein